MSNDPLAMFKPASQIERKLKILAYGPWKTGKTIFALSFTKAGKVAVIDPEMSAGVYGNQYQFGHFPTKDLAEVMRAVAAIKADGGKTYQTLVIDPITILWSTLCDAGQMLAEKRAGKGTSAAGNPVDVVMSRREWGIVKRLYNKLMNELVMLPVHVVITAREKDLLDESERKIGVRPDTEKNTAYAPDIILHFISENGVYKAKIEGYRKMFPEDTRKVGDIIINPSYETFADAVTSGTRIVIPDDDQAIQSAAALLEAEERTTAAGATSTPKREREPAPLTSVQAYLRRQGYVALEDMTQVVMATGLPWKSAKGALYSLEELDKLAAYVKAHPAPAEPAQAATA